MRPPRATVLLTTGLVTLLGIPSAAAADTPSTLYVNNSASAPRCSDTGPGSEDAPFCTISAGAKAAQPGQTVQVLAYKSYDETVTVDRSGEPGKPISIVVRPNTGGPIRVKGLNVRGASHVVVRGLTATGEVQVSGSTDIELDRITVASQTDPVVIGTGSVDVRLTRSNLLSPVRIEGGSRGTVLGRNQIRGGITAAVDAVWGPGTIVTNNTLYLSCDAAVSFRSGSTGSGAFNNLIYTSTPNSCVNPAPRSGILVGQDSTTGTRSDHNLLAGFPTDGVVPYKWADVVHATPAALRAATGQGAHDVLTANAWDVGPWDRSPNVDSGDSAAPGVLPTDYNGYPVVDDPLAPNTGKDGGFIDRGAHELQDTVRGVQLDIAQSWAPVGTAVQIKAVADNNWPGTLTYQYEFGDGTAPVVTNSATAEHVYQSPCACTVTVKAITAAGKEAYRQQPIKVTPASPLATAFTAQPYLPSGSDPNRLVTPLTVEVDPQSAAAPWPIARMTVDYGDGAKDTDGNADPVRHAYKQPGTYKVTVTLTDIKGATSTAERSVQVAYTPAGYVAVAPSRVLDTRTTGSPVQGGTSTPIDVPVHYYGSGPHHTAGASAVVLNVTVTGATEDTHLTVWPSGQTRPVTSNVNVKAGGTSSNTVTVPVGADGKISAQLNSGKAALIVDYVGHYQPNAGQRFTPLAPARVVDTRTAGGALAGGQARTVKVAGVGAIPADATAVAANLTGTGATENAHVIAYPDPAKRPATSNLNLEPGKDKSNQAIVPVGPDGTITLYTNTGSTHLVLDAVGYYAKDGKALFTPAVPQRLADTRTTGKLAPGATTTVTGIPGNAIGAALNVTATDTTGPGFLIVYGHGGTRPEASSLNTRPGETVPNHVTTPVADGRVTVWNSYGGANHVITDLFGYFTQG
ncbi:PKD repeat protein [Streptomyces sp. 2132.2]|uniref:PKD domain-containing protein n=1 Tax=Streptomyces sp. 2132.2 TaxID=2485161 RepID=UPI000F491BCC|nr:PKD domain-containing protein [Streptomyces sp. 2132.2]ROQ98251.1 PKD repeat protein [Streptomyces sp. 2132.2]